MNDGPMVSIEMVAAAPLAAVGGTIANGKYHLTSALLYTGPGGASGPLSVSLRETLLVHDGVVDAVGDLNGKVEAITQTLAASGTTLVSTRTCPSPEPAVTMGYSASGGTFLLFLLNGQGQTVAYTFSQ